MKMYRMDSSFFEVTPDDMALGNYSVVFHCNNGTRAFCAGFVDSGVEATKTIPDQCMFVSVRPLGCGVYVGCMRTHSCTESLSACAD